MSQLLYQIIMQYRTHLPGQFRKTIKHYSYFLNDKIGQGYSSTVYKGISDITHEKVAIKVIQLKFIKDQNTQKLLQTQLQCIKKISHRYLLKFIDTYETSNNLYIITQYCEGGDLQRQLKNKGRFSQNQLIKFFAQFYQGYVNLFQAGFIHRDIKPANILIKSSKIRIADFGIVKKTSQNPKDSYSIGTLVYMAPQALMENIFTQKSDVWAIGIMLYQLAHGHLPYISNGNDRNALRPQIQTILFTYDSSWLSVDCIKFLSRCLDKNPNQRIGIKQMWYHPWMVHVIKLINQSGLKNKKKTQNIQNSNLISGQQKKFNSSAQNLPLSYFNNKSASNSSIHSKFGSQNNSPIKSPVLKFTYNSTNSNDNNANLVQKKQDNNIMINNAGQSPFQRMRQRIIGSTNQPVYPSSLPYIPQVNQLQRNRQIQNYLLSVVSYMRYISKSVKNINNSQKSQIPQSIQTKIFNVLLYQLMICLQRKQCMIKQSINVYRLNGWQQFKLSTKYEFFKKLINNYIASYRSKYKNQFKQLSEMFRSYTYIIDVDEQFHTIIYKLVNMIQDKIGYISESSNIYANLPVFDCIRVVENLLAIYQLRDMFANPQQFTKEVLQLNTLMQGWKSVDYLNYKDKWELLHAKAKLIYQ